MSPHNSYEYHKARWLTLRILVKAEGGWFSDFPENHPPSLVLVGLALRCGLSLGAAANHNYRGCAGSQCACAHQGPQNQAGVRTGVGEAGAGVGQRGTAGVGQHRCPGQQRQPQSRRT